MGSFFDCDCARCSAHRSLLLFFPPHILHGLPHFIPPFLTLACEFSIDHHDRHFAYCTSRNALAFALACITIRTCTWLCVPTPSVMSPQGAMCICWAGGEHPC